MRKETKNETEDKTYKLRNIGAEYGDCIKGFIFWTLFAVVIYGMSVPYVWILSKIGIIKVQK